MALSETDLDRIGDKVKIRVLEAMKEHGETDHAPIQRRLAAMDRRAWWGRGIVAGVLGIVEWLRLK